MGVDFLIDEYPLYAICSLMDGLANLLSPDSLRVIQFISPEAYAKPHRLFAMPADLEQISLYRPLGSQAQRIPLCHQTPDGLQEVVVVDGRLLKRSARYPGIRAQIDGLPARGRNSVWVLVDDRDFGQLLAETFEFGIPFRLYLKRERIHRRAYNTLLRRGLRFSYLSYAVCREHFEQTSDPASRGGIFFAGETERPYLERRKRYLEALQTHPTLAQQLHVPAQRQCVAAYFASLQRCLIGLDLPAGGKITPRRYEVPGCGAALVTVNRTNWLPDDPASHGKAVLSPDSPEALCRELEALLADPQRCQQLGSAGHAWVMGHHTTLHRGQAFLQTVEEEFAIKIV